MSAQTGCIQLVQHPSVSRRLSEVLLFASSCNFVVYDCITALWTSFFHSSLDGVSSSRVPTDGKLYFFVRSLIRPAQLHEGLSFIASCRTIKSLMNSVGGLGWSTVRIFLSMDRALMSMSASIAGIPISRWTPLLAVDCGRC